MTRRKQSRTDVPDVLGLLLTYEEVAWLKHALVTLEGVIDAQPHSLPKLPMLRETASHLQKKLSRMGGQHAYDYKYKVPIAANEAMILYTAVWLFLVAVEHLPDSAEKQEALNRCLALHNRFVPFLGRSA
ncbi:MAG: hypothetical protein JO202_11855 [Ktedonobacteraceae bacterium]|nr:hypothetical protein [Ktedonobacteraceae bacterium]